jgi:hypothetical protein
MLIGYEHTKYIPSYHCIDGSFQYANRITPDELTEIIRGSRKNEMHVYVTMKCRDGKNVPTRHFIAKSAEDIEEFSAEGGVYYALYRWGDGIYCVTCERAQQLVDNGVISSLEEITLTYGSEYGRKER